MRFLFGIVLFLKLLSFVYTQQAGQLVGPIVLQPVNITDNDQFGLSVAMGTSLIACGAPNANNGDGSVYVFDGTTATHLFSLFGRNQQNPSQFGWSVAMLDDDLIAVGAIYYLQNTGAVHVFQKTTSNDWNEIFFSSGLSIGDRFGWRVALIGNSTLQYLAVATLSANYIQIFNRRGDTFVLEDTISIQETVNGFAFYASDTFVDLFVGTPHVNDIGEVRVYRKMIGSTNRWNFLQTLNTSNTLLFILFGSSISVDGNQVYVGAYGQNRVYRYVLNTSDLLWYERELITPPDTTDQFGYSIAAFNGQRIVGAPYDSTNGTQSGAVYVTSFNDVYLGKIFGGSGSLFGYSTSGKGTKFVVGARNDNRFGLNAGAVYLYSINTMTPSSTSSTPSSSTISTSTSSPPSISNSPATSTQNPSSPPQNSGPQTVPNSPPRISAAGNPTFELVFLLFLGAISLVALHSFNNWLE